MLAGTLALLRGHRSADVWFLLLSRIVLFDLRVKQVVTFIIVYNS
jgi:hypothetical protein